MNHCLDCKYWNGYIYSDGTTADGSCTLMDDGTDYFKLAWIAVETEYPEFIQFAVLNTNAKFGCIQWEARE